jgi:starch phosphorylase
LIEQRTGVIVDPSAIFDVQVKRIHEYKRQHLNILHVIGLYHRLKTDSKFTMEPRVFVFGGKAAPGYFLAKLIIRLITAAAEIINRDPGVRDLIKVVYLPNFNVTTGQKIYPAADLSEQVSTAGKEASGTGNMKFQMNGALTIGTVDGANIEICEEVGVENFFLFGLEAHEVAARRAAGYRPMEFVENSEELQAIIQLIRDGFFSRGNSSQFQPLIDNLVHHDPYFVFADYQSYADCQALVDQTYRDKEGWTRMSILNSARSGKFSSDRTIREYCNEIWNAKPVPVQLLSQEEVKAGLLQ